MEVRSNPGDQAQREVKEGTFGSRGMNVLYDSEGCEYPIDDYGQVYVPFELEPAGATGVIEEETPKTTKN